jgi:hypothetical protein
VPAEWPDKEDKLPLHLPQQEQQELAMADADADLNDEWGGVEFNPDDEKATDLMGSIVEKPQEARSENQSDILCNIDNSNTVSRNIALEYNYHQKMICYHLMRMTMMQELLQHLLLMMSCNDDLLEPGIPTQHQTLALVTL